MITIMDQKKKKTYHSLQSLAILWNRLQTSDTWHKSTSYR